MFIRYDRDDLPGETFIPKEQIVEIQLAYALTVHKAQGSESKYVIVAAHSSNSFIFDRRAFYTAVTRAREAIVIVTPSLKDAHALYKRKSQDRKSLVAYRMRTFKKKHSGTDFVKLINSADEVGEVGGTRKLNM